MQSSRNLGKQSVKAVKWSAIGTGTRYVLQLGAQVVLARLLGPENYGLFAMGLLVLTLCTFVADFGLAWGLVQKEEIDDNTIRFTFTWQLITGGLVSFLLFTFSHEVAGYFKESRAEQIIHWLGLACVLNSATTPSTNLLRRQLEFKWINIVQVVSYIVGYICVGIPAAMYGAGAMSLVAAWLVQGVCALVMTYSKSRHSLRPLIWFPGATSLTQIGGAVFGTNLCNWLLTNLDRTIMARYLNAHAVGVYTAGNNLANIPNNLFISAFQPAFLAAGARLQGDTRRMKEAYLGVLASVWILITPIFALLAAMSSDVTLVIYGNKWAESGKVLCLLALAMPAYITWAMSTPILWNTGKKHWEALLQVPIVLVSFGLLLLYSHVGPVAVAAIAATVYGLRCIVMTTAACSRLAISAADIAPYALRGVLISGTSAGLSILVTSMLREAGVAPLLRVVAGGMAAVIACGAGAWIMPNLLSVRVHDMVKRFIPRLGGPVPEASTNI